MKLLANTKGQDLTHHCVVVGRVAAYIFDKLSLNLDLQHLPGGIYLNTKNLREAIQMGAQDGDLGKATPLMQSYFQDCLSKGLEYSSDDAEVDLEEKKDEKNNFVKNNPLHHEISTFLALSRLDSQFPHWDQYSKSAYLYSVYYHHAKVIRDKSTDKDEDGKNKLTDFTCSIELILGMLFDKQDSESTRTMIDEFLATDPSLSMNIDWDRESCEKRFDSVLAPADQYARSGVVRQEGLRLYFKRSIFSKNDISNSKNEGADSGDAKTICSKKVKLNWGKNTVNTLARLCAIAADRFVSSELSPEDLSDIYHNKKSIDSYDVVSFIPRKNLFNSISSYLDQTDASDPKRSAMQNRAAKELVTYDARVCNGAPGSGKTRIALKAYSLRQERGKEKPIIWICPRVSVCQGVAKELSEQLNDVRIQIKTGDEHTEFYQNTSTPVEEGSEAYDILVTTIDQISAHIVRHATVTKIMSFLESSIVFDEFHEILANPVFVPYLYELCWMKVFQESRDITLISGTIAPMNLTLLGEYFSQGVIQCKSFNDKPIQFAFHQFQKSKEAPVPEYLLNASGNSIVFANYASNIIRAYSDRLAKGDSKTLAYHGKFNKEDRTLAHTMVMDCFGKNPEKSDYETLLSGPAAKASLNISRAHLHAEAGSPESQLQQLGRLNRFAEHPSSQASIHLNLSSLAYDHKKDKFSRFKLSGDKVLESEFSQRVSPYFHFWLRSKLRNSPTTMADLSDLYDRFYEVWTGGRDIGADIAAEMTYQNIYMELRDKSSEKLDVSFEATCIPEDQFIPIIKKLTEENVYSKPDPEAFEILREEILDEHWVSSASKKSISLVAKIIKESFVSSDIAQKSLQEAFNDDFNLFVQAIDEKLKEAPLEPRKRPGDSSSKSGSQQVKFRGQNYFATCVVYHQMEASSELIAKDYLANPGELDKLISLPPYAVDYSMSKATFAMLESLDKKQAKKVGDRAHYGGWGSPDMLIKELSKSPESPLYASSSDPGIEKMIREPIVYLKAIVNGQEIPIGYINKKYLNI